MDLPIVELSASSEISPSSSEKHHSISQQPRHSSLLHTLIGDIRPLRALHTVEEVATSLWFRVEILLVYRSLSTSVLVFGITLFSATGTMPPATFGAWAFYVTTVAMLLSTIFSLRYLIAPHRAAATECRGLSGTLADLAVPFVQAAVTVQAILTPLYWAVIRLDKGPPRVEEITQHIIPLKLLLIDLGLSCRMKFRLGYMLLSTLFGVAWLAFCWVHYAATKNWPYAAMYYRSEGLGRTVAIHVGLILGSTVVGVLVLIVTRLTQFKAASCCARRKTTVSLTSMSTGRLNRDVEGTIDRIDSDSQVEKTENTGISLTCTAAPYTWES